MAALKIPQQTVDVGLRTQPNLERLSELDLDTIFLSPRFASLEPQLSRIAPVEILGLYKVGEVNWAAVKDFTQRMAIAVNAEQQAATLIAQSEQALADLKRSVPSQTPPVLLVQFMDSKHVRVFFGENSIYKVALNQLGIEKRVAARDQRLGIQFNRSG
ncbi:ABC transporter substrate-binding protein [Vibrio sinaloensis]|nr:ABC transporter substrate-binding protein [Vibrio sinaloensis]